MAGGRTRRRTLVTGATGFIGTHLCRRLVADGWEVHVILRPSSDLSPLESIRTQLRLHYHDGSTEGMSAIVKEANPEIVFHLASLFLAQHQPQDVMPLVQCNVLFGMQLLEAMVQQGIRKFVNTGTSWQHFENDGYNPVCLYAATKQAFDDILRFYADATPLAAITLQLFDTYGPDDPRPKLFSLLRKASMGSGVLSMSPGEQLIDLVYIDDVIDAFIAASERLGTLSMHASETFSVSSEAPISLRKLVEVYQEVTRKQFGVEWGGRPYRSREVMIPWNFGQLLPGWTAKICLDEGIQLMESADGHASLSRSI